MMIISVILIIDCNQEQEGTTDSTHMQAFHCYMDNAVYQETCMCTISGLYCECTQTQEWTLYDVPTPVEMDLASTY